MADPSAKTRMARHRAEMKARGFKSVTAFLPTDTVAFIEAERKTRRLSAKGDVIAALVAEVQQHRKLKEEGAVNG